MVKRDLFWETLGETKRNDTLGLCTGTLILPLCQHSWALCGAGDNLSLASSYFYHDWKSYDLYWKLILNSI